MNAKKGGKKDDNLGMDKKIRLTAQSATQNRSAPNVSSIFLSHQIIGKIPKCRSHKKKRKRWESLCNLPIHSIHIIASSIYVYNAD
jgi:hypothetical protein